MLENEKQLKSKKRNLKQETTFENVSQQTMKKNFKKKHVKKTLVVSLQIEATFRKPLCFFRAPKGALKSPCAFEQFGTPAGIPTSPPLGSLWLFRKPLCSLRRFKALHFGAPTGFLKARFDNWNSGFLKTRLDNSRVSKEFPEHYR